jgi:hypothetical protein
VSLWIQTPSLGCYSPQCPESTEGPGIFANTTYIQRVNTSGGKAPSEAGVFVGQVARVPYTADYYFYRQSNR